MYNYLTESEAWREIASRIAEGLWEGDGLCREIAALRWDLRIDASTEVVMWNRIQFHLNTKRWAYPHGTGAKARILAALWLALEAEEDAA